MFEFLLILLLIIANGLFAMAEIAIVSVRTTRLEPLARQGNRSAQVALSLIADATTFLSTIQIGITLIGVLAGALGGATLARRLAPVLAQVEWLAPYSDTISFILVVALVTYLSLVIGELVPKQLALNDPEGVSLRVARPMRWLSVVAAPLVWLLSLSTEGVVRLLGVRASDDPPVTEEELKQLLVQGTEAGVFEKAEQQVARRALELDDRRVTSLMTPRTDIVWLDLNDPVEEIERKIVESGLSRLPVIDGNPDRVLGIVRTGELLVECIRADSINLLDYMHKPVFIPASASPAHALELFRRTRIHTVMVVDEYGGVNGLITPTDVLEFIVGHLPSIELQGQQEASVVQREDGSWLVDGLMQMHDLAQVLPTGAPFSSNRSAAQTLNGFVMQHLAHIPSAGEVFSDSGYRFEVVDMDGRRVDKVLVSVLPADQGEDAVQEKDGDLPTG